MNKHYRDAAPAVTVFSPGPHCVQCKATYRALDSRGIPYRIVEVAEDDDATREQLRALGFQQFPVVRAAGLGAWSGFRPDRIGDLPTDVDAA